MGILYNFSRLIKKYSVDCEIRINAPGHWKAGKWVEGKPAIRPYRCAIVPMTERRINNSGGDYKAGDCEIITLEPLVLDTDTFILYKDKKYKVEQSSDYSDYADFCNYVGKRVSSFDKAGTNSGNSDRRT